MAKLSADLERSSYPDTPILKSHLKTTGQRAFGIGLGIGLAGAVALAFRYGLRRAPRRPLPDDLSPAIFARRLASTAHGEMIYHVSGSGQPVIFLHGLYPGASSFEWSRVYPTFVLNREVIAADLIGFGESERPPVRMDALDYAESLADFLRETCPGEQPTVIASGLTAGIVLLAASRHPERIGQIGLLMPQDPQAAIPWASRRLALAARIPPLAGFLYDFSIAREPFLSAWAARFGFADPEHEDPDIIRNFAVCAQQAGARHALLNILRGGLRFDLRSRLAKVPHPVTIFCEESPTDIRPKFAAVLAEELPLATLVPLTNGSALVALENPEALADALSPLLRGPFVGKGVA